MMKTNQDQDPVQYKYTAFKLKGCDHWIWFESIDVTRTDAYVEARNGWGHQGALTAFAVCPDQIQGEIHSNALQYV